MKARSKCSYWTIVFVLSLFFLSACDPEEKDMEDDYDRNYPENIAYSKTTLQPSNTYIL